jgi:alkylated DNA repair protein (DNA oxidative demethylase)
VHSVSPDQRTGPGAAHPVSDLLSALAQRREQIRDGMVLLRGFADPSALLAEIAAIAAVSPFRRMMTPGGHTMSVAMTNCGALGWVSDRAGYRYDPRDSLTGAPWPEMPPGFLSLARRAADGAGFGRFTPDACLLNRYEIGTKLTAHQDRNERDFGEPIVSVSLGLPATFFVHEGEDRTRRARAVPLASGDVVVWGGPARLAYHGVREIKPGNDALTGAVRFNLTFRRAA